MINAAIKMDAEWRESGGNKCTAPNNGQSWRRTRGWGGGLMATPTNATTTIIIISPFAFGKT